MYLVAGRQRKIIAINCNPSTAPGRAAYTAIGLNHTTACQSACMDINRAARAVPRGRAAANAAIGSDRAIQRDISGINENEPASIAASSISPCPAAATQVHRIGFTPVD